MQQKGTKILIKDDDSNRYYFVIVSGLGKILATSEYFNSSKDTITGIKELVNAFVDTEIAVENHTDKNLSVKRLKKFYDGK